MCDGQEVTTPNEMVPLWTAEEMGFFKKYASLIQFIAESNPKAAKLEVEDLVDIGLLHKLKGEGFLDKLYQ